MKKSQPLSANKSSETKFRTRRNTSGNSNGTSSGGRRRIRVAETGRPPRPPDPVRVVLLLSIVAVMLFALYTLFLWPTLQDLVQHQQDYVIEEEEREEHSLKLAPISKLRGADVVKRRSPASAGAFGQRVQPHRVASNNVVGDKIRQHLAIGSGVAAEYNVPSYPVVPGGTPDYPLRAAQTGTIVYGRPGTAWRKDDPLRGLHDIDADHLHGQNNIHEDGSPGWVPLPDLDWSKETLEEKRQRHDHTCFNVRHSDSLQLDRPVPDFRSPQCPFRDDGAEAPDSRLDGLPTTSVVFVFYNEPISPLLRSIHSVLNRSPPQLLKEIILIDDGSDAPWTGDELASYIQLLPKTILKRTKRSGLMVARTEGALIATGDTVTFLDSHIEVRARFWSKVEQSFVFLHVLGQSLLEGGDLNCQKLQFICR